VFTPKYPILTERLSLRPFTMDDLDAVHAIQSREDVARYLYWNPRSRQEVRETLAQRATQYRFDELNDALAMAVVRRDTGDLIGTATLNWASREHGQGELGYVLHPDQHGQGFGTEVAIAMLRLGFEDIGMHRICGRCDGRNEASARVMAKAGMRWEAHLRENEFIKGEWQDEVIYALLASEWKPT
jgi:RimJ/RimL family protein N-acetyltransferase